MYFREQNSCKSLGYVKNYAQYIGTSIIKQPVEMAYVFFGHSSTLLKFNSEFSPEKLPKPDIRKDQPPFFRGKLAVKLSGTSCFPWTGVSARHGDEVEMSWLGILSASESTVLWGSTFGAFWSHRSRSFPRFSLDSNQTPWSSKLLVKKL